MATQNLSTESAFFFGNVVVCKGQSGAMGLYRVDPQPPDPDPSNALAWVNC